MLFVRRSFFMRSWLIALALAAGAGSLLVAAAAGWWSWQGEKSRIGASLIATSRAISQAVDRELDQAVALARGLATSGRLAANDIAGFEQQARHAIAPYGYHLILRSPTLDHQLVNTQAPMGADSPKLPIYPIAPALKEGRVNVTPLRHSRLLELWFAAVEVPVMAQDGQLRYVISILVPSVAFQAIIDDQHLPASWSPVILDSEWTVIARDVARDRFLGQKGGAREFENAPDGLHEVRLLDGDRALSAHSHSRRYACTAAVAMPNAAMLQEALSPIVAAALSGFAMAALAVGAVLVFAARIGSGIGSLAAATRALAMGERIELPRFFVRELTLVGRAMEQAAAAIASNRRDLEGRVAEATRELRRETEERRQAESALAQTHRLDSLGHLTSGVAHDFNNLLTIISSSLELIELKSPNDQIARLARNAQRGAARGARLVEALLAFARKQPVRTQVVNPNLVIKEFALVLKGAAGDAVELQLLLSPTVFPCRVDPAQLQSAILNLVTNARAAMPSGGRITIETANLDIDPSADLAADLKAGSYVQITVADTGTGMSPEVAARAFEPFFTTKDVSVGTGLGLSQVYGFAKQSGGHASISSEHGIGTSVRIFLPRSLESATVAATAEVASEPNRPRASATVLVVDDDPEVRAVLVQSVEALGYRAMEANDGRKALELISSDEPVDLVLTDYLMPGGLSGRELSHRLTALGRNIPLVMISGNVPLDEELGALPMLRKPIRLAELRRAIDGALTRSKPVRAR